MKREKKALSEAALEMIAARFKVMSDPTRLRLLHALESGEMNVGDLVRITQTKQANVSKHLAILTAAGIVARRREGVCAFYFISDPTIFRLCQLMCDSLQKDLDERTARLA